MKPRSIDNRAARIAACCFPLFALLVPAVCQGQPPSYMITTIAGDGTSGYNEDGVAATTAELASPFGIAVDSSGNLYIADQVNHRIRMVGSDGNINTIAGTGTSGYAGDGKAATSATISSPLAVAVNSSGDVFIADTGNSVIRKVSGGNITTFAGTNVASYSGDGGAATSGAINLPAGIALDSAGNLYISDTKNELIRKVTLTTNIITTVAGTGTYGFSGDGGPATKAMLNYPKGVAVDSSGNIFIADSFNNVIREVMTNGNIYTIAGTRAAGYTGDSGPALSARLSGPSSVAVGPAGIYVADNQNNVIRLLSLNTAPVVNGIQSAGDFGASSAAATGSWIEIYGSNLASATRPWSSSDFSGDTAPTTLGDTQVTVNGVPAAIDYISPGQVNAQVPSGTGFGGQPVVVTTSNGSSTAVNLMVNTAQPGLYAPPGYLKINGKQYVGALFQDGAFAVPTGAVQGFTTRPARPGDVLTFYGVGFGAVVPDTPTGQIVRTQNQTASLFQIFFGDTEGAVSYRGLAPGYVGLYQFNVTVPNVAANSALPLTFHLGGVPGTQTLYIAIQN